MIFLPFPEHFPSPFELVALQKAYHVIDELFFYLLN
jgi:hypothetical protein